MPEESKPGKQFNVTSHDQSGGITAGEVHITAPQPSLHGEELAVNEKTDEGYRTHIRFHLDAPYAAKRLGVKVEGTAVKTFDVRLAVSGMTSVNMSDITPQGGVVVVNPPLGYDYDAFIVTETPDNLGVIAQLET